MGNKAHIKIDKIVEYCSECPFCSIKCTGYGKSGCYEHDLWCHASTTERVYTNLRFVDIFQKSDRDCAKDFVPDDCPMKVEDVFKEIEEEAAEELEDYFAKLNGFPMRKEIKETSTMKEQEYFFTAQPVATDDDGHLGYLWQGIVYTELDFDMGYFNPFIKTDNLFYTPDEAIDEAKRMVSHQTLEEQGPIYPSFIDKSKIMDVGDENVFEKWREEMLKELEKDPNYMNPQDDFEWIAKEAESKGLERFEYLAMLQKFYHDNCEKCGTQRCLGVYDREWREGCKLYREELKCMKKIAELPHDNKK